MSYNYLPLRFSSNLEVINGRRTLLQFVLPIVITEPLFGHMEKPFRPVGIRRYIFLRTFIPPSWYGLGQLPTPLIVNGR